MMEGVPEELGLGAATVTERNQHCSTQKYEPDFSSLLLCPWSRFSRTLWRLAASAAEIVARGIARTRLYLKRLPIVISRNS